MKRRNFMVACAASVLGLVLKPLHALAKELKETLTLDNPTAVALGYSEDATKVDIKKYPQRAGEEGKTKFCSNCMLAQGKPFTLEGKEGEWIACQLFPGKLVASKGWCMSWAKKS